MNHCHFCGKEAKKKYCSVQCQADERRTQSIELWKGKKVIGYSGKSMNLKPFVRDYMLEKAENKCSKCGWSTPHPISKKPPLEINHIDGDASNSWEENLEVLCPNCHSLTPNFKNRNKGNGKRMRVT